MTAKTRSFTRYTWITLGANIAVILWGAFVRATGSGAGCGSHWPLCNGEVIPRAPRLDTVIELSHRLTSGVALIMVVILAVWAFRCFERGHPARKAAIWTLILMLGEAAIGAGIVLFELVAENESMARAMFMGTHLANTFLLLAALTLTGYWAGGGEAIALRGQGGRLVRFGIGFFGLILVGVSGSVSALGDTLYPAASLAEGLRQDLSVSSHFLIRLRIFHPIIAATIGVYLLFVGRSLASDAVMASRRGETPSVGGLYWSRWLTLLVFVQLLAGTTNVVLLAPIWMQLVHLLLADSVWIVFVLLAANELGQSRVRLS